MAVDCSATRQMTALKASTVHSHGSVRFQSTNGHFSLKLAIEMIYGELEQLLGLLVKEQGIVLTATAVADVQHSPNRSY
jgi:hypothetical protein